ncbi:peptidoglycan-binding protein [Spirillospora sp. NPDC127200]
MTTAAKVIAEAYKNLGEREKPAGSNVTSLTKAFGKIPGYPSGGYGYPWCSAAVSVWAKRAGLTPNKHYPHTAGCSAAVSWFRKKKRYYSSPKVGDFVYYGPGGSVHVELVIAVTSSAITTIGGNTSGNGLNGAYWNGDSVAKKTVSRSSNRIHGYGRPVYTASPSKPSPPKSTPAKFPGRILKLRSPYMSGSDVRAVQNRLIKLGFAVRNGGADGVYGSGTRAAVIAFQKRRKLSPDGEVGPLTWKALFS